MQRLALRSKWIKNTGGRRALLLTAAVAIACLPLASQAATEDNSVKVEEVPSAEEIVKRCDNKYPGDDQQSQLTIKLKDQAGNERTTVYRRYWKDYKGREDVSDKMVLFTVYPPDAQDTAFMRVAYSLESNKSADQWIYLPELKKIRRVAVRDLGDSFLGSDLTYGDITPRRVDDDEHKFQRIDTDAQGKQYFVVSSVPKESTSIYSRKISHFLKTDNLDECVKVGVDYYDKKGAFLKRQALKWQKIGNASVWDNVTVENVQSFHTSFFDVKKVEINKGVDDDFYSERRLSRGLK